MNKRKRKKLAKKKLFIEHRSEYLFDRDKNDSYLPNDESIDEVITDSGTVDVFHSSHRRIDRNRNPQVKLVKRPS